MVERSEAAHVGARTPARGRASLVFAAYFLGLCLLGFLSGFAYDYEGSGLSWDVTAAGLRQFQARDPNSFMTAALDIARHGWVQPANYWLVRVWPPGFMVIEAMVLRVFGEDAPFMLPLLALSALACATWMVLLRNLLLPAFSERDAMLAPMLPFLFPVSTFFLLSPFGLVLGETLAISFFIIGFLLVQLACRDRSWLKAIAAGLALALSAYMRSQFELLVIFLTLAGAVLAATAVALRLLRRRAWPRWAPVGMVLVTVTIAQLAMAPWRYHNYLDTGELVWVHTSKLIARNSLATEQELLAGGGAFVIDGAGHLACKLEPSYCGKADPALFYSAFFRHPAAWLQEKARVLPEYWMAPPVPESISGISLPPTIPEGLQNLVLLACVCAVWWRLWRIRQQPEFAIHAWFQLSFHGALLAVYTMAHLEARYFYLPKIFGVVALLALLVPGRARHALDNEVNP